jgi:hypothetical protein
MSKALNGAIFVIGIAGASLAIASPASAQDVGVHVGGVGVGLDFGGIAYGYQDGYWDSGHRWHDWGNDQEMRDYRNYKGNHYNDYRHDRDPDMGWRN